jgi:hypothetical protein
MIISFAFGLIGALLILANSRTFRIPWKYILALSLSSGLAYLGFYFIRHASEETDTSLLFPMFTPLAALIFLQITRAIYKIRTKREIILHVYGLIPVKQYERHVTRVETTITFVLLVSSVIIPFLIEKILL